VQQNQDIQSLNIAGPKSWIQQRNKAFYFSFFDDFSQIYFPDGLISHEIVVALSSLIDDFETKLSQNITVW